MSELKSLIKENDESIWYQNLKIFCDNNEKIKTFEIEEKEKEKFLEILCSKFIFNENFKNEEIKKLSYKCICFLLREKEGLNFIVKDTKFLNELIIDCFEEKEKEKDLFEHLRCLINLLHQNDLLRLEFSNYLLKTKFKTISFLIETKEDSNNLFFLSKLLFYSTHNSKSCIELFNQQQQQKEEEGKLNLFFKVFEKCNQFLDEKDFIKNENYILKYQFFESYLSETIKLLFNLFAHLPNENSNLFFNKT